MSFDRVLPRPLGLHHEFCGPLPRKTSSLFEHKIMNDDAARVAVDKHPDSRPAGTSCRYAADSRPSGASSFSSLKRAKVAFLKIACNASPVNTFTPMAPLLTRNGPVPERSSSSPVKSAAVKEPAQFCLCQPDPKIPRPRNAFILYRQHYQASVVAQHPGLPNPEISKIIGEHWRTLPEETKHEWKALAEEEKIRHQQQYPDYRYQPRRCGRDGHTRGGTGIGQNASGSAVCNRCGGRTMNPPVSPGTPLTPSGSSASSSAAERPNLFLSKRYACRQDDSIQAPSPIKVGSPVEPRSARPQQWDENGTRSPDSKRRRFNQQVSLKAKACRDNSPNSLYPTSSYTPRSESSQPRGLVQGSCLPRPCRPRDGRERSSHDPSLKLPPLQTSAAPPTTTPITPFSQGGSSIEATVMTGIPFLNKIKLLARISPPLSLPFRSVEGPRRGPVIAVDGQDPAVVTTTVHYLDTALTREGKYHVRVFDGPELRPRDGSSESGQATVDYLNTIQAWHRVSSEVVEFVKAPSGETKSAPEDLDSSVSPRTIIPQTASLQIDSPAHSSESGVDSTPPPRSTPAFLPVALVPRYQLTTADTYACTIPIRDSYAPLDHWQWMASLWRDCVGPDVTVYIRECEKEELERLGGNMVEVRLQDVGTIVVRRAAGSTGLEEKTLRRVGFELAEFITQ